jgi:hypothetical protein
MLSSRPSWLTPAIELAFFRYWLVACISIDAISTCLYLFLPAGTVAFFGGVATPSATFWCSTAATGDAVSAAWCATALRNNTPAGYRDAARGLLVFSIVHLGAFARGHYLIEAHKGGGAGYVLCLIVGLPLLWWYGFHATFFVPPTAAAAAAAAAAPPLSSSAGSGAALSSLVELPAPGGEKSIFEAGAGGK